MSTLVHQSVFASEMALIKHPWTSLDIAAVNRGSTPLVCWTADVDISERAGRGIRTDTLSSGKVFDFESSGNPHTFTDLVTIDKRIQTQSLKTSSAAPSPWNARQAGANKFASITLRRPCDRATSLRSESVSGPRSLA
jgi:hypothetical protein